MKLPADFEQTLTQKTPEELCEILANAEDYLPEAVAAARAELGRRALPEGNVTTMVETAAAQRILQEKQYREAPLDVRMRILVLIFGFWLGLAFFFYYRSKACKRKASQSLIWILYHLAFMFILGMVSFVLYLLLGR